MLTDLNTCDNYPLWIPLLSVLLSLAIYALGVYILSVFGPLVIILYVLFCLWVEYTVMSRSCVSCCYYGKFCGLGRGIIAPLFFKKGDPRSFVERAISWKDIIPSFLISLIPLVGGIIYLFIRFNFLTLLLIIAIAVLALPATGFMRSNLVCPNCRQRELGCPAEKLFGNKK